MKWIAVALAALSAPNPSPLGTQEQVPSEPPQAPPLWSQAEEIELARSAAPATISKDAAVYVLDVGGYRLAEPGANGFTCLVERSHPASIEPICFDAEGSETVLPMVLDAAALRAQGADRATIDAAIAEGFRTGRYRAPRRPGVAYMLSPKTRFFDPRSNRLEPGSPHLMFYAPYLRNEDIGSMGEEASPDRAMPFVINEGSPNAYIVVLVDPASEKATSPEVSR